MLIKNRKIILLPVACLLLLVIAAPGFAMGKAPDGKTALTGASRRKVPLGSDHYFSYKFNAKPMLGTNILKIQVFDKNDKKVSTFKITGAAGMPSMGTAHDTGEQAFKLSEKQDYLLPVDLVMQGDWEIIIVFYKGNSEYGRSKISLNL